MSLDDDSMDVEAFVKGTEVENAFNNYLEWAEQMHEEYLALLSEFHILKKAMCILQTPIELHLMELDRQKLRELMTDENLS